ncbi:hypothetical protein [Pseudomonas viridiflava]|uniref:hypothetical protein n=1 Tax=Pseudomonas viridiflava TaxID=33069 RepID=UPI000F01C536|nr:hypothetical protein [Pseudomonas viridiflava]
MRKMGSMFLGMACALALVSAVTACSVLKAPGEAAYTAASKAVTDYCALPLATRAVGQLVVLGKVYNSGVCNVVQGDGDLQAQLAGAAASEINALIAARVDKAVDAGTIDRATADLILKGDQASTVAAQEAVALTATKTRGDQAAAVVTESAPIGAPATPAPEQAKAL